MIELVKSISAAQQESSAAVMDFKQKQVSADIGAQKEPQRAARPAMKRVRQRRMSLAVAPSTRPGMSN